MENIDTLIHAAWVLPVEPEFTILKDHSVAIVDGKIHAVLPSETAQARFTAKETLNLSNQVLIPGLINAHTHVPMSLMRGIADDMPLMKWLTEHIWPTEQRWMSEEFVRDGTRLGIAEMLRSGTTCFNDMYFFSNVIAQEATRAGIRATVGLIVVDFPSAWANDANDYLSKGIALHDEYRTSDLIQTAFAPHAPYTVSNDPLKRIQTYADEMDIPIHIHLHETQGEIHQAVEETSMRPMQRLDDLGLLSPALISVHMTQLLDEEIERYAESGGHIVHCPQSNMKLASGLCPVQTLTDAGINVALGTDGVASNNSHNMFAEMRAAALLGKLSANSATAVSAEDVLRMATINGAKALGIAEFTGSLSVGKSADITAVDLSGIETQPVYNPLSQLVYSAGRDQVSNVWVAGKHLVAAHQLTGMDETAILNKAQTWLDKIISETHHA